jgi:hypothetical protein
VKACNAGGNVISMLPLVLPADLILLVLIYIALASTFDPRSHRI